MPTRLLIVTGLVATVSLSLTGISGSHSADTWYPDKWKADHHTGLHITWRFSPGFPDGGNKKSRMHEAIGQWNALNQQMEFKHLEDATESYVFDCGSSHGYNGIFYNRIDGRGGTIARTLQCIHDGTTTIHNFSLKFDEEEVWYDQSANGPNDEHDFGGAATHEVGHATGWGVDHFPSSWDVCNYPRHTMCSLLPDDFTPYDYRSLEPHDKDTFDNAYPDE